MPLKSTLGFTKCHWKWHHSIDRIRVPIRLPKTNRNSYGSSIVNMSLSSTVTDIISASTICVTLKSGLGVVKVIEDGADRHIIRLYVGLLL